MYESVARRLRLVSLGVLTVALCACGSVDLASNRLVTMVKPYKIDIVQGNFVSREQAAALKEGMSRTQVRDILGSPLLASVFHANRWDYVFTFKRQGAEAQARRVTVFFKDDLLTKVQADALPSEAEFVASLDSGRKFGKVPVLEMSEESLRATAVAPKPTDSTPLPPLPTSYPPLEPASN
jgi:outer membrane protein assembly factor BamE